MNQRSQAERHSLRDRAHLPPASTRPVAELLVQVGFTRLRRKKTGTLEDVQLEIPEGGVQDVMGRRRAPPAARRMQLQEETAPGQHNTQRLEAVSKGVRREMQQTSSTWRAVLQQTPSTSGRKDF